MPFIPSSSAFPQAIATPAPLPSQGSPLASSLHGRRFLCIDVTCEGDVASEQLAALEAVLSMPVTLTLVHHSVRRRTTTIRLAFQATDLASLMSDVVRGVKAAQFGPVQRIDRPSALH